MPASKALTLGKEERICSKKLIDKLFNGGKSRSMIAFPIRVVYICEEAEENIPLARMLVSVSKRHFKHAVKRNRVKRQIREAYRKNKHILIDKLTEKEGINVSMAFIWLDNKLFDTSVVEKRMTKLLLMIGEKI